MTGGQSSIQRTLLSRCESRQLRAIWVHPSATDGNASRPHSIYFRTDSANFIFVKTLQTLEGSRKPPGASSPARKQDRIGHQSKTQLLIALFQN